MHSNTTSPTTARPFTLRRATDGDLDGVLALLAETAGWLNGRGVRQWPADGFPAGRITPLIGGGVLYLLERQDGEQGPDLDRADGHGREDRRVREGRPVATLALDGHADPEFWSRGDDPGSALYVHKLAVARDHAGTGLGEALLDWAGLRALALGKRWLRLDCSKDNSRLQDYYRGQRFAHLRTVDLPHRASGALFQRQGGLRARASGLALPFSDRRGSFVPEHV